MKCELLSWGEAGPKPPINSKRHRGILFHHHQPLLTSLSAQGSPSKSQQTLNPGGKSSLHTSLFLATMKVNRKMPFSLHHHANFPVLFVQAKRFSKLIFKLLFFFIFLRLHHCYWKHSPCQVTVLPQGSPFLSDSPEATEWSVFQMRAGNSL